MERAAVKVLGDGINKRSTAYNSSPTSTEGRSGHAAEKSSSRGHLDRKVEADTQLKKTSSRGQNCYKSMYLFTVSAEAEGVGWAFCKCRVMPGTLNHTLKATASRVVRAVGFDVKLIMLAMRITAAILLICSLHVTANGVSQTITLSGKDIPLKTVFDEIRKQSGYVVFYNNEIIANAKPITIDAEEQPLTEFLDNTLHKQGLDYEIQNKTIVLKVKKALSNQNSVKKDPPIDVRGRVVDEKGNPLDGVTVTVKGTDIVVSTNVDGEFIIKEVDGELTLRVTGVNIEPKEFKIDGKSEIIISTARKTTSLTEVVVNKGYYTEKMRNTLGNVGHVSAEEIERQPVQNPLLALQGRVPGIQITQLTGLNGGGVTVRIQGRNSIQMGLNPLIVIDGVPYPSELFANGQEALIQGGSPLNYISPDLIESVDILKDADATAIYGSRAANGAILITTKKGSIGKNKLTISMQQGWSKVVRFADMLNTRQYLDMRYEALRNDGFDISTLQSDPTNYDLTLWDTTRYTNWQKELIGGTALYTNLNASVSGGNKNFQYLIGTTYNRQTTVFPGAFDDQKVGLHFNVNSISTNEKLKIGLTGTYMYDNNHLPGVDLTNRAVHLEPNAPPLYNNDGTLHWAPRFDGRSTWLNPLAFTENSDFKNETKNLVAQLTLNYAILPGFSFESNLGLTNMITDNFRPSRIESNRPERRATALRLAHFGLRTMGNWIIEPQFRYDRKLGKGVFDGMVGISLQKNSAHVLQVSGQGFASDQLMTSATAAPSSSVSTDASFQTKYNAVFGRLNYNWKEKYIINLTARRDGSSRFGSKSKFNSFWSIGTGWIFSEERWVKNISFLSFGKIRASYGTTGNDQIPDYAYISTYAVSNYDIAYQGGPGLHVVGIPNPHLQWEETKKWQGGIDLGFFRDRIVVGISYAHNLSSNQLINYVLPRVTGFSEISQNLPATIRNTSWETTLHAVNVKDKAFRWTTDVNFTLPRNKLTKFPGIEETSYALGNDGVIVGQPLGVTKIFRYAGLDPATGKYMFFDKKDNQVLFPGQEDAVLTTPTTKFYGGLNNTVSYKGFQLDFLVQFVKQLAQNDFYFGTADKYPGTFVVVDNGSNQPTTVLNRWQQPGDIASVQPYSIDRYAIRVPFLSDASYNYDASFIRLKNVSLSWHIPANWAHKIKMQNCSFYMRGENLATITKYVGLDPESQNINSLPPLRTWTVGLKLEL